MAFRYLTGAVVPVADLAAAAGMPGHHLPACFGCGPHNRQGLGINPRLEGDTVVADLEFAPWFQGGPGLVHGGAIAAFFDDLMGFVLMAHQAPGVTARLEVNYLRPIPLGVTLRGVAWLSERDGRKMWVEGAGYDDRNERYIESRALYLTVGAEHFTRALEGLTPEQRARLESYQEGGYYP